MRKHYSTSIKVASGGNPQSAVQGGMLGLLVAFAIIGGMQENFAQLFTTTL